MKNVSKRSTIRKRSTPPKKKTLSKSNASEELTPFHFDNETAINISDIEAEAAIETSGEEIKTINIVEENTSGE